MLQELIGIQRGKGEKNIWFGRLEGSRLNQNMMLGLFSAIMKKNRKSFGRLQVLAKGTPLIQ
jgi:hypothetical protein